LYVNIVVNRLNMGQIPEIIEAVTRKGWRTSVGLYHTLTDSTRVDEELIPIPGPELDHLLAVLARHRHVLTLDAFLIGMKAFIEGNGYRKYCPYLLSPVLSTRLLIRENGDACLCRGASIGNLLRQDLADVFSSQAYHERLEEYASCAGCWTSCYVQRYLLLHPRSPRELASNVKKAWRARHGLHLRQGEA
jgi:MoaA/NifB/PqqE/SkfB family radical SAM enzyme